MELKLAVSPCPNDTFIFYGLIHHKVNTHGISFKLIMKDVEELNQLAFNNPPDVCKLSYHALVHLHDTYFISNSGGAMGFGNGPLLVSKDKKADINDFSMVALPGEHTTAHFLFKSLYPQIHNRKIFIRYDKIENFILQEPESAGVLIHESRFTYQEKGLSLISDLGLEWQNQTNLPVPLGGIGISKKLPHEIQHLIPDMIRDSLRYSEKHPDEVFDFMKHHAQELDREIIWRHVRMFVNNYSFSMEEDGKKALTLMAEKLGIPNLPVIIG
jgi:1,4-dihydroxy-6-naphthoate synthase